MKRRDFFQYSLLFITGCVAATSSPNGSSPKPGAGTELEKLRFAVSDTQGIEELQRDYEPFRQTLEEVLAKKIEFFPVENFIAVGSALQLDRVEFVMVGPSEYVIIHARTNAVPVVALTRPNYYSVIAVRANSRIKSVAELKGKTIAMGSLGSTGSHLGPTKLLLDAGLNPQSDLKIIFLGSDKSQQALKNGEVDAWGGTSHRYEKFLETEGVSRSAFRLIATGSSLPNDVFIASSKLDSAFVEEMRSRMLKNQDKLIQALLATEGNQKFKGSHLAAANDADYNMIRETYQATGQGNFSQ